MCVCVEGVYVCVGVGCMRVCVCVCGVCVGCVWGVCGGGVAFKNAKLE